MKKDVNTNSMKYTGSFGWRFLTSSRLTWWIFFKYFNESSTHKKKKIVHLSLFTSKNSHQNCSILFQQNERTYGKESLQAFLCQMKCINCWTSVVAFPFSKHSLLTPKQIQVFLHATAYIFIVCTYHLFFLSSVLLPSPPLQKALTKQLHPAQSPSAFQAFGCLYVRAEHGPPTLKSDSL